MAVKRMRAGIEMLRTDPLAEEAFRLANRAMLDQMRQADRVAGRDTGTYHWRPFQLAFLLTTMASVIREQDPFRDVLDLIWFPPVAARPKPTLASLRFSSCGAV